jgi:hypothetical protein
MDHDPLCTNHFLISCELGRALLVANSLDRLDAIDEDLDKLRMGIGHTSCILAQRPSLGVMLNTQGEPGDGVPDLPDKGSHRRDPARLGIAQRDLKCSRRTLGHV